MMTSMFGILLPQRPQLLTWTGISKTAKPTVITLKQRDITGCPTPLGRCSTVRSRNVENPTTTNRLCCPIWKSLQIVKKWNSAGGSIPILPPPMLSTTIFTINRLWLGISPALIHSTMHRSVIQTLAPTLSTPLDRTCWSAVSPCAWPTATTTSLR